MSRVACIFARLAIIAWIPVSGLAQGPVEIFLSPTGSDADGDGSAASPLASVGAALVRLGDAEGTILFQPGDYTLADRIHFPPRPSAGSARLIVKSSQGKSTVRIHYSGINDFAVGISSANLTLEDLQFHSLAPKIILAEMSARNLIIRNCVFNQTASTYEGSTSIVIDGNLAPSVDNILIQSNTFIEPKHAALEIFKPVISLHFIGNTAHLPGSAHGLSVLADGYSGIVADNNIFQELSFAYGRTILQFTGKGKGTRISLNCFSASGGRSAVKPANKLASNSLLDLQLPFRSTAPGDEDPGSSTRGTCFDIYAQEKLSVLRKP